MRQKICFFVSPIGEPRTAVRARSNRILRALVRAAAEPLGFRIVRVDLLAFSGSLSSQIRALLREAELVIADLSGANVNVFYELGFRHGVNKPCVHLVENGEDLPFDVADLRAIFINSSSVNSLQRFVPLLAENIEAAQSLGRGPVPALLDCALEQYIAREYLVGAFDPEPGPSDSSVIQPTHPSLPDAIGAKVAKTEAGGRPARWTRFDRAPEKASDSEDDNVIQIPPRRRLAWFTAPVAA